MNRPFRNGKVHVMKEPGWRCIKLPGRKMHVEHCRVKDMIDTATSKDGVIVCHQTLDIVGGEGAICRGFFDQHPTQPLQLAERLDRIEWVS